MLGFFMVKNKDKSLLSAILDLRKIKAVDKPIEQAHGLPNECYTSNEYLKFERDKIFSDKWTVIGAGSSIPNTGNEKRKFKILERSYDRRCFGC